MGIKTEQDEMLEVSQKAQEITELVKNFLEIKSEVTKKEILTLVKKINLEQKKGNNRAS